MGDTTEHTNTHIMEVPEGEKSEKEMLTEIIT